MGIYESNGGGDGGGDKGWTQKYKQSGGGVRDGAGRDCTDVDTITKSVTETPPLVTISTLPVVVITSRP